MTVNLSYLAGAGAQFFDNNGVPLGGGLLYTYSAGTTTQQATYTSSSGSVANSNPIVLDASGRVINEIWLTGGQTYKFVLQTASAVQIWSFDNISGINDFTSLLTQFSADTGSSLVGFLQAGSGAITTETVQTKLRQFVDVIDFGADPTGATDSTTAIQAAITYACSLVNTSYTPDAAGGATVLMRGIFKVTSPLSIPQYNVGIEGQGGATLLVNFSANLLVSNGGSYNGAPPVFIVGTGTSWQTGGNIGYSNFYNYLSGLQFKLGTGVPYIGILLSGTRNSSVKNCTFQNAFAGIYLENASEILVEETRLTSCYYGYILDNRGNRIQADSVLNVACTDNDVSSCSFNMNVAYYCLGTAFLLINTGTIAIYSATIGFWANNLSNITGQLGLPNGVGAGIHIWGGSSNNKWTRGFLAEDIVFEASQSVSSDCIRLETNNNSNPIFDPTFNNCVVQTFASSPATNVLTTFINAIQSGTGLISNVTARNCGFTFGPNGYYTGQFSNVQGTTGIVFDNCFPTNAFPTSNIGYGGRVKDLKFLEAVAINAFPPSGWTANGTTSGCSVTGGSNGVPAILNFTGDSGAITISKNFVYREYVPNIQAIYISFLTYGTNCLSCYVTVNGDSGSASNIVNSTNITRYGNAIVQPVNNVNGYRRIFYCFNMFDDSYPFDNVTFYIGKAGGTSTSDITKIYNIEVGYVIGAPIPYNPFS